jgi:hypothetical protein
MPGQGRQPFGFVRAYSADIRANSAMFGGFPPGGPNGPEFARTAFGFVRVCSARAIHRKTYCVFSQKNGCTKNQDVRKKAPLSAKPQTAV